MSRKSISNSFLKGLERTTHMGLLKLNAPTNNEMSHPRQHVLAIVNSIGK